MLKERLAGWFSGTILSRGINLIQEGRALVPKSCLKRPTSLWSQWGLNSNKRFGEMHVFNPKHYKNMKQIKWVSVSNFINAKLRPVQIKWFPRIEQPVNNILYTNGINTKMASGRYEWYYIILSLCRYLFQPLLSLLCFYFSRDYQLWPG